MAQKANSYSQLKVNITKTLIINIEKQLPKRSGV